ncbi:MAG: hypothetical protein KTR13_07910 [Saprospiraceae bacterium]|nr:hypothetical protein [Saprospiraceae bacterium]
MKYSTALLFCLLFFACKQEPSESISEANLSDKYTSFQLTTDLSALSANERKMIPLLIEAAEIMDGLFWQQAYGDKNALLESLSDADIKNFAEINYGPWDRLEGNASFVEGVGDKPLGANYYPADVTKEEVEEADASIRSLYTMVRRDNAGKLTAIPYSEYFKEDLEKASGLLTQAAEYADDPGLKNYLTTRAAAFLSNEYFESDMAWMDMTENGLDVVIGPIETYEDQLIGAKAAFEAYVLVKDKAWSARLAKYASLLPALQKGLPVDEKYKAEEAGSNSQLNAYDVVYYAGDCNSGSKTIAINLPNDEKVQLAKGSRRLQLKNAMQAKFDKILVPISKELIADDQQDNITFDAFFGNTMFHEVAHGLGIKNTINGKGTVREALKEHASALEEGKADILGLYMITKMAETGDFPEDQLMDNYVTFLAGIFRSTRFGASSAHGKANMLRFNYFQENEAFNFDEETGKYSVDFEKMKAAMNGLSELILTIQGDGDYAQIDALMKEKGKVSQDLQNALDRVNEKGIPVDIVFEQGTDVLGL